MTGNQYPTDLPNLHQRLDVNFALQAAGLGVWELDPATRQIIWDDRCRQLFGLAKDNPLPYDQAIQYVHPDDVERVDQAVAWALNPQSGGRYDQTYRTVGADDGLTRWVRFCGQAYFTQEGDMYRFAGMAQEVTGQVAVQKALEDSEARFRSLIQQAPVAMLVYEGPDMVMREANEKMLEIFGRGDAVLGKPLLEAVPELRGTALPERYRKVLATGETHYQFGERILLLKDGQPYWGYYDYTYKALRDSQGTVFGVICTAIDVSVQVLAQQALKESQQRLLALFEQSPVAIAILSADNLTFQLANSFYGRLVDRQPEALVGKPLLEALPEIAGQGFDQLLRQVIQTGQPFVANEVAVDIVRQGHLERLYVDLTYQPQREADNSISGIFAVAIDVTEQVKSRQQIEASERKLQELIAAAPVAIGLLMGRDLVVENPNQTFIDIAGKGPSIEGLPLRQAMPELVTYGQQFLDILDDMFTTGIPFNSPASLAKIVQDGVLTEKYYNISYFPIRNAAGEVYAIVNMSVEVTSEVLLRQQIEQTSASLQSAIELAELGTFSLDVATGQVTVSPRTAGWFGFDDLVADIASFVDRIGETERETVLTSLNETLLAGSDGRFDVSHAVINTKTGRRTIIHSLGQVHFDAAGQPVRVEGTAQDITAQRELQQVLEQQVQVRTEELAASNEELTAINEELAASNEEFAVINEELEEANSLLTRSNNNLQTFAYVASHDLQEPLRKIQQFGDLLKTRFADSVTGEELVYLERMQLAASRMSTLIKDLLSFSRISTRRNTEEAVSLNEVVAEIVSVLDVLIAETGAQVDVEELPVLVGDRAQLGQLWQNLLSNALKFHQPDTAPRIRISSQRLEADQLPPAIKPARRSLFYHRIAVADNGIGFDEKYLDRIFQVFQRLHGKNAFAGTGMGLAICEKIVANHGGVLTAESQPGQGATFYVYLPA